MMHDLTEGKPSRVLLRFCLPLFGSVVFQQLYNLADSLVAGRFVGENALAAVGNSYELTLLFLAVSFGCNIGCSVVTAQLFGAGRHDEMKTAIRTALIASGGHSHIVAVQDYTDYRILGRTRDDAAGESFDKVARVLGLPYPGGPKVEKAAREGNPHAIAFPRVRFEDNPFDFSFSGTKTAVINYVHNLEQKKEPLNVPDIAASFTEAVCEVLTDHAVRAAIAQNSDRLVLAGGVAANAFLREKLTDACRKNRLKFFMPLRSYCGDNAAMIASQGYYEYLAGNLADETLNGYANQSIETLR